MSTEGLYNPLVLSLRRETLNLICTGDAPPTHSSLTVQNISQVTPNDTSFNNLEPMDVLSLSLPASERAGSVG